MVEQSAAPEAVEVALLRLIEERPETAERLVSGTEASALGRGLVTVLAASRSLARLCLADASALEVLDSLDVPVEIDAADGARLARSKRLELLRIAARDLMGTIELEEVGSDLASLAERVLEGSHRIAAGDHRDGPRDSDVDAGREPRRDGLAIIGMGKLGGRELNYASDVDVLFVTAETPQDQVARRLLEIARGCFRVDANLRPDGRSGPLTRSLDSYRTYWRDRAASWEMQSLIKARAVAGDRELGRMFADSAASALWERTFGSDELAEIRRMKARAEEIVARRGMSSREIKRGPGGIRDVEFAVQLLQLVHGRHDAGIRDPSTLGALFELSDAGYIGSNDASTLAQAYRFLRLVEHRLQLVEEEQTHEVPVEPAARRQLAQVLGFADDSSSTATQKFDHALRSYQSEVREVHERLFFRPLLESFGVLEARMRVEQGKGETPMGPAAVADRLTAFGFADVARTRAAVAELASGLTRSSRLMMQLLPLLLDWLSLTPDPDLGLLGLRNLVTRSHARSRMVETFRDSPEAARRLCLLLGSSRPLAEYLGKNPELIGELADDRALAPTPLGSLVAEAEGRLRRPQGEVRRRAQLIRLRQDQFVRIASRDLLGIDDVETTGGELTSLSEALVESALASLEPQLPFCVIGLGRFGGSELSYASDLDVIFVYDSGPAGTGERAGRRAEDVTSIAEATAESLVHFLQGPIPAQRVVTLDLGLRPEGAHGRLARDLHGYSSYYARWAQTWERQAMSRARVVAGDHELGERFMAVVHGFVWDRRLSGAEVSEIRRMKARIERERIPAREDPEFHLKLGRGSLSDVEWTVQLLQLLNGVVQAGTMRALDELRARGAIGAADADALRDSYRFCERTRNRWYLVGALPGGGAPGDSLPAQAHQLSRLARSLGTTPATLRDEYRRVTRRARRVMERLFYGIDDGTTTA